jgi:hypothetical protein
MNNNKIIRERERERERESPYVLSSMLWMFVRFRHKSNTIFSEFFSADWKSWHRKKIVCITGSNNRSDVTYKQLVHITVILRSKNIFSSLESFQRLQLLNTHLVNFELSFHLFRDLFCWQEIRSTVGSISVKYLIFRIYFFGQILILYHITFF